ncbi:acetyl-CoA hydrolase/transferase family protein [Achromobacter xylosoxidans]|uniref:acetyl-CoA hydrolase/transferase family protein n=1 Tax=Alcaligenes xylosoxydans xylosoxydans TaxID=85698 RepID=UPI0006656707|nr:acetyl-CoA hydrolase/transferase C-terminal domain-containing protein [Achromobacter xylosoxidans]
MEHAGHTVSPDLARHIRAGDTVVWGQADAQPLTLIRLLVAQRLRIGRLRLFLGIGQGLDDILLPAHRDAFDLLAYCGSGSNARLARAGALDILPAPYSDLPGLMLGGPLRADVVMLRVSPPDAQGRHSLGMAREYLVPALARARVVLAETHPSVPWTFGGPYLQAGDFDLLIDGDDARAAAEAAGNETAEAIGRHVADLVEDGATLQTGIGAVPDAVLAALRHHRDLGMHSGSLGDGLVTLAECGALTNARKGRDAGVTVGGVLIGGERLRRHAHYNPRLTLRSTEYTHDAQVLASLARLTAINSAIEVDLSGQANSEVAGGAYVGAVGGILDFLNGAHASRGGVPIVALPSMARGRSRIVARLSGPATVPRACPCVIVTEHGAADLRGLSLSRRIDRLLGIADPTQREALERELAGMPAQGWTSA